MQVALVSLSAMAVRADLTLTVEGRPDCFDFTTCQVLFSRSHTHLPAVNLRDEAGEKRAPGGTGSVADNACSLCFAVYRCNDRGAHSVKLAQACNFMPDLSTPTYAVQHGLCHTRGMHHLANQSSGNDTISLTLNLFAPLIERTPGSEGSFHFEMGKRRNRGSAAPVSQDPYLDVW